MTGNVSLDTGSSPHARFVWIGVVRDPSGHADELRGFLRAQEAAGDEPALHEFQWTDKRVTLSGADEAMIRRQKKRVRREHDVAVHTYLPRSADAVVDGTVNVGRVMFETDRLPPSWLAPVLERDEIWVPCRQNFEAFADSGIPANRMRIVGETIDFDLFSPAVEPYPLPADAERFTFLTNFDFSARKGWETLLRAWGQAFTAEDPVRLVLKTGSFYRHDGYVEQRIETFLREEFGPSRPRLAPLQLLTDLLPARDMPRLYAASDAYVLASRGEGWGRPYMEAQAMGLPTIASRWGGTLDFMDEDTSWFVGGELIDVPDDAELFNQLYQGHRWFDPDTDDLAAQLREIARDPSAARHRAAPARERLIARFGPEAIARSLREAGQAATELYRDPRRPRVIIRGEFGAGASLAAVNDGLVAGLEDHGFSVRRLAPARATTANAPGISHSWPHDFNPVSGGPTIMVIPWEYGAPPAEWVREARAKADRVWVPSAYVRQRFVAGGMPPGIVEVVPNGFDPGRFSPDGDGFPLPRRGACTFLFVGGTIWRKGIDLLLAGWEQAFGPEDDVTLVIKDFGTHTWYRGQTSQASLRMYAGRRDIAPVVYLDEDIHPKQIASLYRAADVLVVPYRGEGFCLPALEAMACGVPVMHTGTGPTAEFVPPRAGWALAARQVEIPDHFDIPVLAGSGHVQEVDLPALVAALRQAAADPEDRRARAAAARTAAQEYTWSEVTRRANDSLQVLVSEALPPARFARPQIPDMQPDSALVLYAPTWHDEARWRATLELWVDSFTASEPVTLALHPGDCDPEELAERILCRVGKDGRDPESLPDLLLCRRDVTLNDLSAVAAAVLVEEPDGDRPELVRRAVRVVSPDRAGLAHLRAALQLDGSSHCHTPGDLSAQAA